jgi:hypothetical protein
MAASNQGEPPGGLSFITQEKNMLYTIAVILLILWLLGLVSSYTIGGFIHVLLVIAIVIILIRIISGNKPL